MKTYYVTMSNKAAYSGPNTCAANAIQNALEKHLGQTVIECHTDGITFEIPRHDPLPLDWKPKRRTKAQDQSAPMFDDDAIRAESINAKEKAARSTVFSK